MPTRSLALLAALLMFAGCGRSDEAAPPAPEPSPPTIVAGPLCDELPGGTEPGAPYRHVDETADVVLQWIPVLTIFEAAVRATGMDQDLSKTEGVTILAPTDDAFEDVLTESTLDALIVERHDDLRALLRSHMVDGVLGVEELARAGTITTLAGDELAAEAVGGGMVMLDGHAQTLCADYRAQGARIHVIDGVLGELPEPAPFEPEIG